MATPTIAHCPFEVLEADNKMAVGYTKDAARAKVYCIFTSINKASGNTSLRPYLTTNDNRRVFITDIDLTTVPKRIVSTRPGGIVTKRTFTDTVAIAYRKEGLSLMEFNTRKMLPWPESSPSSEPIPEPVPELSRASKRIAKKPKTPKTPKSTAATLTIKRLSQGKITKLTADFNVDSKNFTEKKFVELQQALRQQHPDLDDPSLEFLKEVRRVAKERDIKAEEVPAFELWMYGNSDDSEDDTSSSSSASNDDHAKDPSALLREANANTTAFIKRTKELVEFLEPLLEQ